MHPENISDVRKFETKIAQSGMNEEARKEAEKVLNRMKQEGKDSHEYGMLYDYLDFVTSLSWKTEEQTEINLTGSRRDSGRRSLWSEKSKRPYHSAACGNGTE